MEACHNNGEKQDNRLSNLRWDTKSANSLDSIKHGTHSGLNAHGERNSSSKLTNQQRRQILYEYSTGLFSQEELGKNYDVNRSTISYLCRGATYPYVDIRKILRIGI
jgi:hypothetical protein